MARSETYVSVDIEADGPVPGLHSLLSIGAAAYRASGRLLGTFAVNLEPLPGATAHPRTVAWWQEQPEAWAACREDLVAPELAMARFAAWVAELPGRAIFVGYPASFDFAFVSYYFERFGHGAPFGHAALCVQSFAMALGRSSFDRARRMCLPERWRSSRPHTHRALDDALEQGEIFLAMLAEMRGGSAEPR
ncbi:MAG: 3'-5' exoribonuclease [Planctomycetes bacterium]|nr:3'-5' exoribonuclease [Planctomycetota bacterium]